MNSPFLRIESIQGLETGPLVPYANAHLLWLRSHGYKPRTAHEHLRLFAHVNGWMLRKSLPLRCVNEEVLDNVLKDCRRIRKSWFGARFAFRRLLVLLREAKAISMPKVAAPTPVQRLVNDFCSFLTEERGCTAKTGVDYGRPVHRFLSEHFGTGPVRPLRIKAPDVIRFVRQNAVCHSREHSKQMVTGLRAFLRYLYYSRRLSRDLSPIVPTVPRWRLTGLPKYLSAKAVQRVLDRCDQTTHSGIRNYAILLLLARLGLRAGEIIAMQLEDVDWENAQLLVRSRKGRGPAQVPLPFDVGQALARYLKEGRPKCNCRNVFVRTIAPYQRLSNPAVLSVLAMNAIAKAGVSATRRGAHVFRHSLATAMLKRGASLQEIGQVLRHHDPDTTAIYAKVDLNALRSLALPWPGGAR